MTRAKENAPTVQSQRVPGMKPPRIIARFCESWGITPHQLLVDIITAPFAVAIGYATMLLLWIAFG